MFAQKEFSKDGIRLFSLACINGGCESEIWIAPDIGMNLCRWTVDGRNVIDYDPDAVMHDFSGTPLLYPTPNRVYRGVFRYNGREYPQVKRGSAILTHGLVYDEPFDGVQVREGAGSISIAAHIDFQPGSSLYESFPFRHRLWVLYELSAAGVCFRYEIDNQDTCAIPYGIALHPYFMKLCGEEGTLLRSPHTKAYLNIEEDLIPTGELIDVAGTPFDLLDWRPVGDVDLDTVFTGNETNTPVIIRHGPIRLDIFLECSPEFTHMVIYTPPGEPFFCLENQTCSTDAHNLYDKGFREESGLRFAGAGAVAAGTVRYWLVRAFDI